MRRYREDKATQAAAYLLNLHEGYMPYMKLIKLLYVADRFALLEYGRPITYDNYYSLDRGPILSKTLDLITEGSPQGESNYWEKYISEPVGYSVRLIDDCPYDELSDAECDMLNKVNKQLGHYDRWALVELLHKKLPEWEDPHGSALPISYSSIFEAAKRDDDEAEEIEAEISHLAFVDSLLGS